MQHGDFSEETLSEPYTLSLTKRDVLLIRLALQELLATYTRHDHMFGLIHDLLQRLPAQEELKVAA